MDQLQGNLYKLLVELDDICKRNNVIYYLAGGTALGAIRGGGFLPWDDDIDLYITRDNWDKLVKVMEKETPKNRIFICTENDDLYCNPVGRYVDKDTTVMMKSQLLCGKACGQLIEFFVMDPMPKDDEAKKKHKTLVKTYAELLSPYFVVNKDILYQNPEFDFKIYNKYYLKSLFLGKKRVLKELLEKITSTDEDDSDYYCMRWGQRNLIYGKETLGIPRYEKFENAMFPVPAKQEEVARIAYGDSWMYIPEGSGKVVHNLNKDLMTPFQEYVNLYKPLLNEKKLLANYQMNKRIRTKALLSKNMFKNKFALARAEIASIHIRQCNYNIDELMNLLNKKDFEQLENILRYYYSIQFSNDIKVDKIFVDVDDDFLYVAIMNCVLQGKYYKVSGLMNLRKRKNTKLTHHLSQADKIIDLCKKLSIAIYDKKDVNLVKQLLSENVQFRDIIDYSKAELWLLEQQCYLNQDYSSLLNLAKNKVSLFSNDGEIIRYEAFSLYKLGYVEDSKLRYLDAIKNTRNGFVWKEIKDLFNIDAYDMIDNEENDIDDNDDINDVEEIRNDD